ncbi:MAG: prephenate dehydrogenase [Candidatus Kryptoniota bacterium]
MDEFETFNSSQPEADESLVKKKIGVIGCGMIGGSIALSLSKSGHDVLILDLPQNEKAIAKQIPLAAFKKSVSDFCDEKPDIIFICVPSEKTTEILLKVSSSVIPGTIITDVAGVKTPIMHTAKRCVPENVVFVGGHPMAGSEKSGVEAAQPFLFQNAVYVLSPLKDYPEKEISPLLAVIQLLGARILFMDSAQHDKIAAATSHLPQLIAVELVNLISELSMSDENFNTLAAGGFRDMTRIASSDFAVWKDVISSNRGNIGSILSAFIKRLSGLDELLAKASIDEIAQEFESARTARSRIRKGGKGFLRPLYDLYVIVEDKVGVLKEITSTLADFNINIKDIELLKVREGAGGMFRLSFDTEEIQDRAARILEQRDFQILRKDFEG